MPDEQLSQELQDEILELVEKRLSERQIKPQSIGTGNANTHQAAPKGLNQQFVKVNLTNADLDNVDVPHTLGVVPTYCVLWEYENPSTPDTFLQARPIQKEKWTKTNCRVAMRVNEPTPGTKVDCIATFQVGGE